MNPRPSDELLLAALMRSGFAAGEVVGWLPVQGDWIAAVAHADRACLMLLPAGGSLWGDIPVGQKRFVTLADQSWAFVAGEDGELGAYQRCHLAEAADGVSDIAVAREVALDALKLLGYRPEVPATLEETSRPPVSRRGFLRALTGRR